MLRNKIYYRVKPFVPQVLRTAIRRELALRVRDRVQNTWPIMPGSERKPENWSGWPESKQFALVLTHDVEGQIGVNKSLQLMRLEQELGFRSSFNFIPEGPYVVTRELRDELTANGFEIGVHDLQHDGRLYGSRREFIQKAARINHYVREWGASGFRSGFMLHNLDWLHELDIVYDASTFDTDPFEPQPEGRNTVFPFWVDGSPSNNGAKNGASAKRGYVELPYTLPQDSTLFLLLRDQTPEIWFRKLDWVAEHGGMVLLDTHPDYMAFNPGRRTGMEYPVELYREFLQYVRAKYGDSFWHALPRDVARYFVEQRKLSGKAGNDTASGLSSKVSRLRGRRGAVVLFSHYPADPRPRRAAEALAAEGVTIDVICLRKENENERDTYGSVNVYRVPVKRRRGGKLSYLAEYSAFLFASFAYLAVRSLKRRYDFVHVHNMPDVLVFSAIVPKLLGAKVILDLHDPMPELMQTIFKLPEDTLSVRLLKLLEKWSIGFADIILTVNLTFEKIFAARSCRAEKITVVINSPDDAIFKFQPLPAGGLHFANGADGATNNGEAKPFTILYHGSLVRRNGFDLAVDALELVCRTIPSAKLAVCGERTPFLDSVLESAKKRGLGHRLDYLGHRSVNEIVDAINQCDVGIIPNHRNIFTEINTPTRIFEYLALGKPVVAPKARGIQDYFGDDDLIFFELGDAEDLARKIEYVAQNPDIVAETVRRGQQIYLAHTWSREKAALLNAVSGLV